MVMVINWWSAARLNHYSFLNLSKTVTSENYAQWINERQWKLSCLHLTGIGQQNGPNSFPQQHWIVTQPMLQKLNNLGCKVFFLSAIFTCPLNNRLPLSQDLDNFLQGRCFLNQQEAENVFQEFIECQTTNFYAKGNKQTYFSLAKKKVLIVMVPILINKDVFEPSYNDLKFMVPNCKYTCTNLIFAMILVNVSWVLMWVFSL